MARSLSIFEPTFAVQRSGVAHQLESNLPARSGRYLRRRKSRQTRNRNVESRAAVEVGISVLLALAHPVSQFQMNLVCLRLCIS
jgi:hypothetical protein